MFILNKNINNIQFYKQLVSFWKSTFTAQWGMNQLKQAITYNTHEYINTHTYYVALKARAG